MKQLQVREDLSEVVHYTVPHLPIRATIGTLASFPNKSVVCHWHRDLECILVLEGAMQFWVNEMEYRLTTGSGIFVNSSRLHFNYSSDGSDCTFAVFLFHPSLLGGNTSIERQYVNPLLYDASCDALVLSEEVDWKREAWGLITMLFQLAQDQSEQYELQIQMQLYALWLLLYRHIVVSNGAHERFSGQNSELRNMVGYIQRHYAEKLSLNDIAAAGMMCRSKCCEVFQTTLHQTPFTYLLHYRIEKSLLLLADDTLNITAIAASCGFGGASYYTEVFRRIIGTTPSDYRKRRCPPPNWRG